MYKKKHLYSWEEVDKDIKKRLKEIAKKYIKNEIEFDYKKVKVRYDGKMDPFLSDQIYYDSFTVVASETSDDLRNTTFLIKRIYPGLKYKE